SNLAVMGQDFGKGAIALPGASVGAGYRHTLQAAGGSAPYSWSIASGSLPAGLTLSSAGVITGTAAAAGNYSGIVFRVTDNTNASASANVTLAVAGSSRVARPSWNSGSGFFVYNGKLYDPNGNEFRIRGVNLTHFDSNSSPGIVKAQANTVRYGMYLINTAPATPNAAIYASGAATQYVANGVFTIIADFYTTPGDGASPVTGNTNPTVLADIVSWWVANEASFAPLMDRIAINIANEWGPADSTVWRDSYITAIARLRAAGYSCPLVIDSGSWGQDPQDFLNYGQAVLDSDPQKNVIFSLHIYSDFYDSGGGVSKTYNTQPDLQPVTDALVASGLPIIYGEFGPGRNLNGPPTLIAPARVIAIAEAAGFGWMPWSWDSNNLGGGASNNSSFSMTFQGPGLYSTPAALTWYGLDMALNPAHGWNALASPAPVFLP
ncbi:MAG: cellulase family glycosylhydrolase, partial [Gammaproteobacteria bacterium]|nr:cellulase family glycosylhydrolase [Gammaproteobacteria bacterium]